MTRTAMRANDPFFLRLRKHVHHASEALRPIAFSQTMHQADVDVVDAELAPEAVKILPRRLRSARKSLGQHRNLVARHMLQRLDNMRMTPISIRRIKKSQPVIVAIQQEIRQPLHAQRGLIGMMTGSDSARAHGETAGADSSLAQLHGIEGVDFLRQRRHYSERPVESPRVRQPFPWSRGAKNMRAESC